jgi:hypothetical protein
MQPNTAAAEAEIPRPTSFAEVRDELTSTIRLELVGPDNETDDAALLNEILNIERPLQRYKAGVLYPKPENADDSEYLERDAALPTREEEEAEKAISKNAESDIQSIQSRHIPEDMENIYESETMSDLALSGLQRPASMAISFFVPESALQNKIIFSFAGGTYREEAGQWIRSPLQLIAEKPLKELFDSNGTVALAAAGEAARLRIRLKVFIRKYDGKGMLITYSAVNETPMSLDGERIKNDARCAYQTVMKVNIVTPDSGAPVKGISAYPAALQNAHDPEEVSLALLYRHFETFAVGHGCSAEWDKEQEATSVDSVRSTAFPEYETFSITPDLERPDGKPITVSMRDLAAIGDEANGLAAIDELVTLYNDWIAHKESQITALPPRFHGAAKDNLVKCKEALARIKAGRKFIDENAKARQAFRLANKAILIQQKRFSDKRRDLQVDENTMRIFFEQPFQTTEATLNKTGDGKGSWRPFQIAFLLLALKSAADGHASDREHVDLIWFPTGGGKTEAYFGLAAFSIFYRRLLNPQDAGVSAIMRYTLRLLTADQFERASGLICALEYLRRENEAALGADPFSIGIWLGQSTTPNTREEARKNLRELKGSSKGANKFLVTKCPWCSAQIGPVRAGKKPTVQGYKEEDRRVKIYCTDNACDFHQELPIYVVDEDIYEFCPTLIIGTVDKFAQIAWDERCRAIFGIDTDGVRHTSPPGLIIQDELHLISGPLGSMVGLYETIIEEFCTDYRSETPVKPKIICSTATIRRFESQIRSLYGRTKAALFPAPGLEASDSFFAKWQSHEEQRGRKYIGIYAPGESIQTMQVRSMSIALQGAKPLHEDFKDPWWTLLIFFNSLRELGNTITLFQSDILSRLSILRRRAGLDWKDVRKLNNILELTSRLKNDEIDGVRAKLKHRYAPGEKNYDVIDVCLASNIIEVGVDISRLGLMAIVGQPKTTAQYIQVSGRVGRTPGKPGLVLTIYSASKPRDRSHFEKFRSYHERLYAQVEPTSVTPFSGPALERALHAVIIGYLRQTMPVNQLEQPWPIPQAQIKEISAKIRERVACIYTDPQDRDYILCEIEEQTERFISNWRINEINRWVSSGQEVGLIYRAGSYVERNVEKRSKKTPQSMRNVDMECKGTIAYPKMPGENRG